MFKLIITYVALLTPGQQPYDVEEINKLIINPVAGFEFTLDICEKEAAYLKQQMIKAGRQFTEDGPFTHECVPLESEVL